MLALAPAQEDVGEKAEQTKRDCVSSTMASLAEQFLDDVESSENDEEQRDQDEPASGNGDGDDSSDESDDDMALDTEGTSEGKSIVAHVSSVLQRIDKIQAGANALGQTVFTDGSGGENEEYNLVVECMEMIADIEEEILSLHRQLKESYAPNFPELETLIFNPLDYARVAKLAANEEDLRRIDLRRVLPSGTVITVQVTAASSARQTLNQKELNKVYQLCDALISLDASKTKILEHVESRAGYMAPNLVEIVGGAVAAKLMGIAGGLRQLACMPSCNVKVLGKEKKALQGSSSATTRLHEGIIFTCPLVLNLPKQYRSKAGDVTTGKASLAARVDTCREQRDGGMGRKLRQQLEEKFVKWQEPPPAKTLKPLPVPGDEAKRKHRGGKRARREKERLGLTDVRRLTNRVKFGKQEETMGNDLENEGFGMLGAEGSKRLRIQTKKTDTVSIAAKRRLAKQKSRDGISEATALGITTNLAEGIHLGAMTPAPGGVGLGSMDAKDSSMESNYFSTSTPFFGVQKNQRQNAKPEKKTEKGRK